MKHYLGPASDHFDGEHFFNPGRSGPRSTRSVFKWLLTRKPGPWRKWTDAPPGPPPPQRVSDGRTLATFVGHSTLLIQMAGMNILTDPIWSHRASPLSWIGPPRHRPPGLRFEDLPPIDLVLQSHDHYDHYDIQTLRRVAKKWRPKFVAPLGVGARLESHGIADRSNATELDWWQAAAITREIKVTAVPARHFSGRGLRDRNRTLWCGYVVEGPAGAFYFAGDTAYGAHFKEIRKQFPVIRLAFIPIGAIRPEWLMGPVHISPADAVRAHLDLGAATSIGIHFGTFRLADDGEDEPVMELQRALDTVAASGPRPRFWTLGHGEGREIP
jgi:L-ascorbate metabolism protein UlaG (beta-lactamase superfamily)